MTPPTTISPDSFPQISGYTIVELLYLGSRAAVYRAVQDVDRRSVAIKVLRRDYPSFGELVQFRNQYTIAKNLPIPGIVQPLSLEPLSNSYALVMADEGGVALEKYSQQRSLELAEVLEIALQLADILHDLGQHRVVHKDIKPANILIHPASKRVKLTDFSIASELLRETQEVQHPHSLEGTLAYLAPEQTGRMNRGIDYRADFYALGVTLYELLTGELPFLTTDPLELVHSHLAKSPIPPHQHNPQIPRLVSEIVLKLMAKNAEERYQSALGLKYDLEQCYSQWQKTGKIAEFILGERDRSDRFLISEKLYGREAEVEKLLSSFARIVSPPEHHGSGGRSEMMLVAGGSGIGKTAVINEVHKPIARHGGYFIKGKFDQFNRNIPFAAIVQACRDLIQQLLGESDAQLMAWKTKILAAVGENGQAIVEVIPELERIIGTQPNLAELSGLAAQNRFKLVFQKFVGVFAEPEHPVTLFIDDLQWADSASLKLLQVLIQNVPHLLIIGAYRDNEVSSAHPLMLTLQEIEKTGATIETIELHPLKRLDVNRSIADTLKCDLDLAQPLTQLVYRKTQGNPFFTSQFLQALYRDGAIQFNPRQGGWECDLSQIEVESLTDDVVELMTQRLQKLSPETQDILKLAACVGAQFDLQTLAIVCDRSIVETGQALGQAVRDGAIVSLDRLYKFFCPESTSHDNPTIELDKSWGENCRYRFLHDRVQQAAYNLIPSDRLAAVHLQIGRLLLQRIPQQERESHLFQIVDRLNRGEALIENVQERAELAQLNLQAGRKARLSAAYDAAMNYLQTGLYLLAADCWRDRYLLTLELHQLTAEVAYLSGDYDLMTKILEIGLAKAHHDLDRVKFYETNILALIAQNRAKAAVEYARSVLPKFGVRLPQKASSWRIALEFLVTLCRMAGKNPQDLLKLPPMTDPYKLAACDLLTVTGAAAGGGMPELLPLTIFRGIALYLKYGNIPKSSMPYAIYGFLLCDKLGQIDRGYAIGQAAIDLCQQTSKAALAPTLFLWHRFIAYRKEHLHTTFPFLLEAYQVALEVGDIEYAAYSLTIYVTQGYWTGKNLADLQREAIANRPALQQLQHQVMTGIYDLNCQVVENLQVEKDDVCHIVGRFFDETTVCTQDLQLLVHTSFRKLQLAYLFERYPIATQQMEIIERHLYILDGTFIKTLFYFYSALMRLAIYPHLRKKQQRDCLSKVKVARQQLSKLAKSAPMNYQHKLLLVEAEYSRMLNKPSRAIDYYDRAIAGAKTYGYLQEEALANELAAKFYLGWGKDRIASSYMQEAYYCYARWGAKAKTDKLEECYPELLRPMLEERARSLDPLETLVNLTNPSLAISVSRSQQTSTRHLNTSINIATIIQTAQSLSSTIDLEELLQQLTKIILQYSGGDRCALILPDRAGEWQVRAIATPETTQIQRTPLTGNPDLPTKLIQYVKNTQKIIVVNDLQTELPVIDDYLLDRNPKSLLCLPILKQGELIGILYLKNRSMSGAFNHDHLSILNFLCIQAAISLENARLFAETMQAEASLRQSQIQLQNTANNLPGIVYQFRLDADGNPSFPFISDRSRELMGFDPQMLQQSAATAIQCMEPPDREMFQMLVAESIKTLQPFVWTGRFNLPSGEQKWIETRSIPTRQADGAIVWDGVMLDVSDRKLVEANLVRSEAKFRSLVEDTTDLIYSFDLTGIFTYISPQLEEITGYQPAELIGRSAADFTHPEDIPLMMANIQELLTTQTKQNGLEIRIPRKNGGWCWVVFNNSPVKDTDGKVIGIQGIGRDVTAEKAVLQERQRQADALQAIVEGTAGKTGADFYQTCTKYLAEIFDVQYAFLTRLLDPDFNQSEMLSLWTGEGFVEPYVMGLAGTPCLATYQNSWGIFPSALQSHFPNASALASLGGESYLSVVIRDFDGNILGNLGIIDTKPLPSDTSALQFILQIFASRVAAEMKRQADEDALLHTNHRLEFTITELQRATRLKDEFLAAMSHELRTPLNAILGLTEGLQEEVFGPLNQQQLKSLATIERSGTHLLSLISDILDLSKISAGKLELELTEVSVVNLCKSSLTFVKEQAYQKQIALALDLPSTLAPLIADERRLQQVLINLLSNAVKFTPAGGKVALEVEFQSTPSEGEWLCFWVKDTGIGIVREDLSRLFQPFIQIDSRLNRQYEGTGLGLSLVKQIIELHGGTVGVDSELGQGSCFYFHLPYRSANNAVTAQTDSTQNLTLGISLSVDTSSQSPQILLVEDNEANIATISEYLTAKGYSLKIATSGREAIEMVKRELPKLILMDIQMPEMDGLTTISHLRQHPPCADTPIIALTALAMPGDREKCLVAGANDYVTKPVALKQLVLTIEQWLANEFDRN